MDLDGVLKHHSLEGPSLAPPEHFPSAHLPSAHLPSAPASCSASRKHREEKQLIEATRENFQEIARAEDIFEDITLTADAGFHTEANMKRLFEDGIDGYVADTLFRKRDPRFAEASRYKEQHHREGKTVGFSPTMIFITIPGVSFAFAQRARSSIGTGAMWSLMVIKP